ncbi:MAG: multicopper oxidase domain-containing protein [Kiritimatiellia bacterium]
MKTGCMLRLAVAVGMMSAFLPMARADVVTNWNTMTLNMITNSGQTAITAARALAMVHVAIYDSVNALDRTHAPFRVPMMIMAPRPCSTNVAAAAAAHAVLSALYTNSTAALNAAFAADLAAESDPLARTNGAFLGNYVGGQIVAWRQNDGSTMPTNMAPYVPGTNAGDWRPTFPGYQPAMMPHWAMVTPFAMTMGNQFRPPAPPVLTGATYAAAFDEVKQYSTNVVWTNAAQPDIVWFWVDMPGTVTTAGRWNQIAQLTATNNSVVENARLFAMLNVALADAGIGAWDAKYYYNAWRPITAIREADTDGNPLTVADTNWVPFITNTPAFPEYVSAHSAFSAAAAAALSNFYGANAWDFTVQPYNAMSVARTYASFSEAAREAAISRLWAGIHFSFGNSNGLTAGEGIGNYVSGSFFGVPGEFVPDLDGIDTDGDGNVSNDYVNLKLSAGDGFVKGADGRDFYCFGFSDITGLSSNAAMMAGMLAAELSAPTLRFKEGQHVYLRLLNVGMLMRPDLFDPHTVHFHGFPNAAPIFDGEPMASVSINMAGTITYYYEIVEPGTFMYHCHVEATEHMEMGMLGNLYVAPIQNNLTNGTILSGGFVHSNGFTYVYNDGDGSTRYDVDYPIQLGSFDSFFHEQHIQVQPLPFSDLKGDYPWINGRGYPDTINPGYITNMNGNASQKLSARVTATQGQKILLRISNLDTVNYHTMCVLGIPMTVVGRGARLLRAADPDGGGPLLGSNLYYQTTSVTLGGGQSCDAILDTAGVPTGTYVLYSTDLRELNNGPEDYGGMMTEIIIQ